jgi:hypothetical protein
MNQIEFIQDFIKEKKEIEFFKGNYPLIKKSPHDQGRRIKFITLTNDENILVKFCFPQETKNLNELTQLEIATIYQRLKLCSIS